MDEDAPPAVRFSSFSPVFMVRDLPRALAHYAALGFAVEPVAGGVPYGFADRDGVSLHLTAEHAHAGGEDDHDHSSSAYLYVDDADALSVCTGRLTPSPAVTGAAELTALAGAIAARTRVALAG